MEIWKDIIGYDGLYQISNLGNVYSNITNKQMKPRRDKNGYLLVNLHSPSGKSVTEKVHRLVALHFCEKRDGCKEVNHIDCNRANNNASNLEWVTRKDNVLKQRVHNGGGCYHKKYLEKYKEVKNI